MNTKATKAPKRRQSKRSRNQGSRKKSKLQRQQKNAHSKSVTKSSKIAPSDKLKHLKNKQQNAAAAADGAALKNDDNEIPDMKCALSLREIDQLEDHIHEYLVFHGYDKTAQQMERERITNSYTKSNIKRDLMNQNIIDDDAMR